MVICIWGLDYEGVGYVVVNRGMWVNMGIYMGMFGYVVACLVCGGMWCVYRVCGVMVGYVGECGCMHGYVGVCQCMWGNVGACGVCE